MFFFDNRGLAEIVKIFAEDDRCEVRIINLGLAILFWYIVNSRPYMTLYRMFMNVILVHIRILL